MGPWRRKRHTADGYGGPRRTARGPGCRASESKRGAYRASTPCAQSRWPAAAAAESVVGHRAAGTRTRCGRERGLARAEAVQEAVVEQHGRVAGSNDGKKRGRNSATVCGLRKLSARVEQAVEMLLRKLRKLRLRHSLLRLRPGVLVKRRRPVLEAGTHPVHAVPVAHRRQPRHRAVTAAARDSSYG